MAVMPVVRYMILCDAWLVDEQIERRIHIIGLVSQLSPAGEPPYPLRSDLCVFLALTEGYGSGLWKIICVHEASGKVMFRSNERKITFGPDPLEIGGVGIRLRDCIFPHAGLYSVQFWFEGQMVEERPLRAR